jgi:hypothetical protein
LRRHVDALRFVDSDLEPGDQRAELTLGQLAQHIHQTDRSHAA